MKRSAFGTVLLFFGIALNAWALPSRDLIQPVTVQASKPEALLLSDMFYAPSYPVRFLPSKDVSISLDAKSLSLTIKPKASFRGASLVGFTLGADRYDIPVIVRGDDSLQKPHVFRYVPGSKVGKVTVSGSFNNWSKPGNQLLDKDNTGVYEYSATLEPGSHNYKFIVDGKEILDPANPEKAPTGFDGFNSVVRIADPDSNKVFLHVGKVTSKANEVVYHYALDSPSANPALKRGEVLALVDNKRVDSSRIAVAGRHIQIRLPKSIVKGERTLRVITTQQGKVSNMQQAVLHDGLTSLPRQALPRWEDSVIYSIMIDRFKNGDPSNDNPVKHEAILPQANYMGGDLRGVINKLKEGYFSTLGVNVLWISPVYDNPNTAFQEYPAPHRWYSGYHGYWPISDQRVEEKFGTMAELKELVATAHQRGIRVLLDFVAHHVHIDHPLYKQHPEWFGTLDLPDGRKNLRLWDEFRLSTWFEPYMPSFDYEKSKDAIDLVAANAVWWLKETGADGFRHDAVKHVPNLFWRELTRKLKAEIEVPKNVKVYQIGETFGEYDLIASYVNNGQLNAQFNFNLSYFAIPAFLDADKSFSLLDFHMKRSFAAFGPYNIMGNIMDSHDKVRFMAYADGKVKDQGVDTREMAWGNPPTVDHPSSYKKAAQYLAFMFTIPGLPVVYYGSEFGMTGVDDPDNRRMMRFDGQLSSPERQMLDETKKIAKMRNDHSALRYGDFLPLRADERYYAYLRSDFSERLLVVLNKAQDRLSVDLQFPGTLAAQSLTDINSGEVIAINGQGVAIPVDGIGWRVFKVE